VADAVLVVLGNEDKTVMEETIRQRVNFKGKTRIVCRSGNPLELSDLDMVSLNSSRAVVVLSPGGDDADSQVIKIVLAVTNHPSRDPEHRLNIVAEIYNPRNMEAARIISHGEVEWIQVGDFIARVIAQTCRQSGLSVVYTELLDFGGDEVYFHLQPELIGKTFAEALQMYPKNAVMGICPQNGFPRLNPPNHMVLQSGDELILMAADDDEIHYRPDLICIDQDQISNNSKSTIRPESALILGWNRRGSAIVHELNNYAPPGSQILIVANSDEIANQIDASSKELISLKIAYQNGDTTSRNLLDSLNLKQFDHIILLCYSDTLDPQQADSRTLITLLHLRDIATKKDCHFSIVSEMLDVRNRNLADITRADDFIVSDRLVSLMMAQVAENPRLNLVFQDLFDPDGSEIYLKPASDFIKMGVPVNFYTVVEAASQQNSIAIGYRLHTQIADSGIMYGVHLNPLKTDTVVFSPEDRIILLAEE
jgi:ion channel POLLUX/CASTOR